MTAIPARARFVHRGRTGLLALLGLYLVARLVILVVTLASGHVFTSYDTFSYALRGDPAVDRGPVVSLLGHSPRLWGVPVFYAVLPSDGLRAAGQWLVGTLAWSAMAWVLWDRLRTPAARWVGAGGVLLLALHNAVGSWDFALLSESLSVSLGVAAFALLLRWSFTGSASHRGSPAALAGGTAAAFWWTFTRPDIRVFTVFLVVALTFLAWRVRTRRRAAAVAAGVLVVAIGWCSAIMGNVTETGRHYSAFGVAHSYDEWLLFRLRVQVLPDPAIKAVFTERLGLPACPRAEAIATQPDWDILNFADAYYACPELAAWGEANRDSVFGRFAVAAPAEYARMTTGLVNESMLGGQYAQTPSVLPPPLQKLAFPGPRFALVAVLVLLAAAVALVAWTRAYRADRTLVRATAALTVAAAVSTLAGVVYGTGEFWRFGLQEAVGLRLAVVLFAAAAVDAYLRRRSPHKWGGLGPYTDHLAADDGSSVYARQ